jgi:ABC-type sugar transport system substrate-binding protein
MKKRTLFLTLAVFMLLGILLAACAPAAAPEVEEPEAEVEEPADVEEEPAVEEEAEPEATEAEAEATEAEAASEDVYLAMVMHQAIPYTAQIQAGWELFCESHDNVTCEYAVPDQINPETQIGMFESFISKGVQGIVTNCTPADLWVEPVKAARAQGILVNSVDVACVPESTFNVQVGPLYRTQGEQFAAAFFDELEAQGITEGQVVFGYCAPGYDSQENRMATLLEECEARGGYECVGNLDSGHNTDLNYAFWESATIQYADAVAFAGTCAFDGPNLMKIKQLTGGTWQIGTYDLEPETLEGLQSGDIMIAVGNNPVLNGYLAGELMYQSITSGEPLPEAGLIDTPAELVTSRNVEEFLARENDPAALEAFILEQVETNFSDLMATIQEMP